MPVESKKIAVLRSLSLLIIGITTVILFGSRFIGIGLSDIVIRVLGIVDLLMLPVLAFTTWRMLFPYRKH